MKSKYSNKNGERAEQGNNRRRIIIFIGLLVLVAVVILIAIVKNCSEQNYGTQDGTSVSETNVAEEQIGETVEDVPVNVNSNTEADTPEVSDSLTLDEARAKLDLTETYYTDLQHGDKGADYQKYIVLHDTEGGGTADDVLSYWEGNGNLVAAHFVVNKDGSILQCVPLDKIAHHAGWGSGEANQRFGIEEDGRDDLLGRADLSGYTDYGMNAWSIGIEMVHIGGESYPEEQLDAVDDLIAYIDAYYGGDGGTIIDHKMWREGNSDTNPEFSDYLANYQDHRTHD